MSLDQPKLATQLEHEYTKSLKFNEVFYIRYLLIISEIWGVWKIPRNRSKFLTCRLEAKFTGIGNDPGAIVMVWRPDTPAEEDEEEFTTLDKLPRLEGLMTCITFSGEIPLPSMVMKRFEDTEEAVEGDTTLDVTPGVPSSELISFLVCS